MNIEIMLMAFAILIVSWALTRILSKTTSLERHVVGMRKRLNELEQRLVSSARLKAMHGAGTQQAKTAGMPQAVPERVPPQPKTSSQSASGISTICAFCGEKFDIGLEKCPKCNHINIEKYRIRRKSDGDEGSFDI